MVRIWGIRIRGNLVESVLFLTHIFGQQPAHWHWAKAALDFRDNVTGPTVFTIVLCGEQDILDTCHGLVKYVHVHSKWTDGLTTSTKLCCLGLILFICWTAVSMTRLYTHPDSNLCFGFVFICVHRGLLGYVDVYSIYNYKPMATVEHWYVTLYYLTRSIVYNQLVWR